jgi:N-carbamoyl-L-amino-acid hydrolase
MRNNVARPGVDGERLLRDLDELAAIGATPAGGVCRVAYSPDDMAARDHVAAAMAALGMDVRRDAAGNVVGTWRGREAGLPPLALGSHTDTVPDGGRFDGALGVVAALACVRALGSAGVRLRHRVEVIDFAAEEATMGGGTFGSRAMAGLLAPADADLPAWDGRPAAEHLRRAGLDPAGIGEAARPPGCVAAYLELHIEQGAVLERAGAAIGLVEGIAGIRRYAAVFEGQANHAGTTPMAERRDALVMAAPFVLGVRDAAVAAGVVGTVGQLQVRPGAPSIVPGRAELSVDVRGLDTAALDRVEEELKALAARQGGELRRLSAKSPSRSAPDLLEALERAASALGLPFARLTSGAGHDAMCMAALAPQAMLFVPSRAGISHSPLELTEPERCVDGARVLLGALLDLDERLDR